MSATVRQAVGRIEALFGEIENNTKLQILALAIITLIGTALRFYKLDVWSFWIEENHSLRHASALGAFDLSDILQVRGPFYLVLRAILTSLGESEWTARLLPAAIGMISLPIFYWLVREEFGLRVALLTVLLFAIAPWHIFWSQNARFYTLLLFFFGLSLFAFHRGMERNRIAYFFAALGSAGMSAILQPYAAVLVLIFILYFLLLKLLPYETQPGLRYANLLLSIALPLLAYALYEVYLIVSGKEALYLTLYRLFFNQSTASFIGLSDPYIMLTAVVYRVGTPVAALSLVGSLYLIWKKHRAGLLMMLGAYVPLVMIMLLTPFASTSDRYVFMSLPCWIILAAVGVKAIFGKVKRLRIAILISLLLLLPLFRDPAVEDIVFYAANVRLVAILSGIGVVIYLLGIFLIRGRWNDKGGQAIAAWRFSVLFVLLAHPLALDGLYYEYQNGYRDDLKAAASLILQEKVEGDIVLSWLVPTAAYYLPGMDVFNIGEVDLNEVIPDDGRGWYVLQEVPKRWLTVSIQEWVKLNCDLAGSWDRFMTGRYWDFRVFLCVPEVSAAG